MEDVHLEVHKLTREAGESDAHWKERVRRFLEPAPQASDHERRCPSCGLVMLACACGPKGD